uniref:Uncharacterized protein n=1 Tax=Plectus sambesii TaxID=2011161 RepID=A0A914VVG0_9BILA
MLQTSANGQASQCSTKAAAPPFAPFAAEAYVGVDHVTPLTSSAALIVHSCVTIGLRQRVVTSPSSHSWHPAL